MSAINIRRDVKDVFYRYKMPRLLSKIEGKGNGIKTVVPNMTDIAKALNRPPSYPTKYFGCELGAQVKCDEKTQRYIVNGAHDAEKLQTLLDGFIQKFVLCPACHNPETDLVFVKNDVIIRVCKACGQKHDVDMRHKLVTFILNNPPPGQQAGNKKASKKDRKTRNTDSPTGAGNNEDEDGAASQPDSEDERVFEAADALPRAEDLEVDDDDWAEDTSPEAVAARQAAMARLAANVERLAVAADQATGSGNLSDEDEQDDDPADQFGQFLMDQRDTVTDDGIVAKATELDLRDYKALAVLVQVLFNADILNQLPKRLALLKRMCKDDKCQKGLLGGLERLIGLSYPEELLTKTPLVLKYLYFADVLEEDVLLSWGRKISRRYVDKDISKKIRRSAAPFLSWLENAESDDEDDD